MTTEEIKQGKPLSPTAQKVMNIASILGAIATVVFIVWAWQKRAIHVTRDVISLYASSGNLGPTNLYLFTNLTNRCSNHSRSAHKYRWCLYLRKLDWKHL